MKQITATIVILFICFSVNAEEILFSSQYSGELGSYHIVSTRTLTQKDDGSYRFQSIAKHALGSITETTDFRLEKCEIYPTKYHYLRRIIGFKKEESIDYDWKKKQATYRLKGKKSKTFVHDLVPGLLDSSVYQLQLQRDAWQTQGTFNTAKPDYTIIAHRKIKSMQFEPLGKENLNIGDKNYSAIKVEMNSPSSEKLTTVWLLPELNYQIGKISHRDEDGDTYEITLDNYVANDAIFNAIYPIPPEKIKIPVNE